MVLGGVLLGLAGSAYLVAQDPSGLAFDFLASRRPLHQRVRTTGISQHTVAVYCFGASHESVCSAAGPELRAQGYEELTPPIDYSSREARSKRLTSLFLKRGDAPSTVSISTGRFLGERPDGEIASSDERDWVTVVVRQDQAIYSWVRRLRSWLDGLFRRRSQPVA